MTTSKSGFTIVELLIVIVVIAILAAISIVAYTGIQTRAQASAIASELEATEKALHAYKITSSTADWWDDDGAALTGSADSEDITIADIISARPEFRNFLQSAPTTEGLGTAAEWTYDNDKNTYDGCSLSGSGVNISIDDVTNANLPQAVDNAIDDGDLSCGKLRETSSGVYYNISRQG